MLEVLTAEAGGDRLLDPDSSLVLCGSFARREMVTGSDCDWTLLINGVVNNHHGKIARLISNAIVKAEKENKGLKSPGTTGTFGNLTFSHDLVHRISEIHISELDSLYRHQPMSNSAVDDYRTLARSFGPNVPVIIESMLDGERAGLRKGEFDLAKTAMKPNGRERASKTDETE